MPSRSFLYEYEGNQCLVVISLSKIPVSQLSLPLLALACTELLFAISCLALIRIFKLEMRVMYSGRLPASFPRGHRLLMAPNLKIRFCPELLPGLMIKFVKLVIMLHLLRIGLKEQSPKTPLMRPTSN